MKNKASPRKTSMLLSDEDLLRLEDLLGGNTSDKIRMAIRVAHYVQSKIERASGDAELVELDLDALRSIGARRATG